MCYSKLKLTPPQHSRRFDGELTVHGWRLHVNDGDSCLHYEFTCPHATKAQS